MFNFSVLGSNTISLSSWSCGQSDTWTQLKEGFKKVASEYQSIAERSNTQVSS